MSGVSGAREFAAVVRHAARDITPEAEKVLFKGAMNVKKDLQSQMRKSSSFSELAGAITFDIDGLSAEIGPTKAHRGGNGTLGFGANIAYFGGANGGGGTVEDPEEAGKREAPYFEKWLAEAAVKSFD